MQNNYYETSKQNPIQHYKFVDLFVRVYRFVMYLLCSTIEMIQNAKC